MILFNSKAKSNENCSKMFLDLKKNHFFLECSEDSAIITSHTASNKVEQEVGISQLLILR